ncbi:hypothetical protein CH370_09715 [Leptospira kmetyi]|uniref:hypothetical protein n=1 Tax=Leptospira kmetyi TaxID=408139 RepID=UPI000C2ABC4E|nr:hypothetical protein [Leptospira kmetyi]PJZ41704.1 hypothetical protein CH370_09715 [Leptospira kmetyi]
MKQLPYIDICRREDNVLIVKVEDAELFDYIEDYLIENCNISEYSYMETEILNGKNIYKITFHNTKEFDSIEENLLKLNPKDLIEIYKLNN